MPAPHRPQRDRYPVAVHLFFLADGQVLLARRANTGWGDGHYSVPAGHVDAGESVTAAAVREAREEVGLHLHPEDFAVVHVMHRRSDDDRIDFFLAVARWEGEPTNCEPHKCDDLRWFGLEELPPNIIPYVRHALKCLGSGEVYSEFGW